MAEYLHLVLFCFALDSLPRAQHSADPIPSIHVEYFSQPTPRSEVVLKKLISLKLVRKPPTFYGSRNFIILPDKCSSCLPTLSKMTFNIIPSSTRAFSKWSPSFRFSLQNPVCISLRYVQTGAGNHPASSY